MLWLDAATCPKDGTEFIAYDVNADKMDVCVWDDVFGNIRPVQSDGEYGPLQGDFGCYGNRISHWMPLPARPGMACEIAA